jgi:hypothetical protein
MNTSAYDPDELEGIVLFQPDYLPSQASQEARRLCGRTIINQAFFEESENLQLKIQPFKSGGYEATVRWVNAQRIADMQNMPRCFGKREPPEERSQESLERSRIRARQKVRYHSKNIAANRLLTLTKRESPETGYSTPDDWQKDWARFCRVYTKYFPDQPFMFVAVLEQHKDTDHLHLHIATYSKHKMPLEIMRRIWWEVCGGRGLGNVDIRYIRQQGQHGTARIAKYLSKYISKGFDALERFNKKRYWVSDRDLPQAQRIWLRSRTIDEAISEVFERSAGAIHFGRDGGGFFLFPDRSGFWFAIHPGQGFPPPF